MNRSEAFRTELTERTPDAIAAVRWVLETTNDPRVWHDAYEWLSAVSK